VHQTHESDGPLLIYHLTREGSSAAINRGRGNSSSAQQALEMWKSLRQYHKPQSTENPSQLWNVNEFDKFFSNEPRILYARPTMTSSLLFSPNTKRISASSRVNPC
jgi:hypothetical protein